MADESTGQTAINRGAGSRADEQDVVVPDCSSMFLAEFEEALAEHESGDTVLQRSSPGARMEFLKLMANALCEEPQVRTKWDAMLAAERSRWLNELADVVLARHGDARDASRVRTEPDFSIGPVAAVDVARFAAEALLSGVIGNWAWHLALKFHQRPRMRSKMQRPLEHPAAVAFSRLYIESNAPVAAEHELRLMSVARTVDHEDATWRCVIAGPTTTFTVTMREDSGGDLPIVTSFEVAAQGDGIPLD